jgi:hypothetical protein
MALPRSQVHIFSSAPVSSVSNIKLNWTNWNCSVLWLLKTVDSRKYRFNWGVKKKIALFIRIPRVFDGIY